MRIAAVGTGYVGLVVGTCLAETGNSVRCVDNDERKIAALLEGQVPIYEPGLQEMPVRNAAEERLRFGTDLGEAVRASDVNLPEVAKHALSRELAAKVTAWRHPGVSAHLGDAIPPGNAQAIEDLAGYIVRNPLSLKRLVYLDGYQAVIYRGLRPNPSGGRVGNPGELPIHHRPLQVSDDRAGLCG